MIDEHERTIRRRFDAIRDDVGPSDWPDVERRVAQASRKRVHPSARGRRLGGAIAAAGALAVGVVLLFTTSASRTDTTSGTEPRSVHLRSTVVATGGRRFAVIERIDFGRRVYRTTYPQEMSSPEEPFPMEMLLTADRVFGRLPEKLRVRTGGRAWVSAPVASRSDQTASDAPDLFDGRRYSDPLDSRHGLIVGDFERFVFDRDSTLGGAPVRVYRLREPSGKAPVGEPIEAWVDVMTGRLARADFGDSQTDVVAYDEPFDTTPPPPDQVYEVATPAEYEDIIRPEK